MRDCLGKHFLETNERTFNFFYFKRSYSTFGNSCKYANYIRKHSGVNIKER